MHRKCWANELSTLWSSMRMRVMQKAEAQRSEEDDGTRQPKANAHGGDQVKEHGA